MEYFQQEEERKMVTLSSEIQEAVQLLAETMTGDCVEIPHSTGQLVLVRVNTAEYQARKDRDMLMFPVEGHIDLCICTNVHN